MNLAQHLNRSEFVLRAQGNKGFLIKLTRCTFWKKEWMWKIKKRKKTLSAVRKSIKCEGETEKRKSENIIVNIWIYVIRNGEVNSWDNRPGNQLDVREAKGFPVFRLRNQADVLKNEKEAEQNHMKTHKI